MIKNEFLKMFICNLDLFLNSILKLKPVNVVLSKDVLRGAWHQP